MNIPCIHSVPRKHILSTGGGGGGGGSGMGTRYGNVARIMGLVPQTWIVMGMRHDEHLQRVLFEAGHRVGYVVALLPHATIWIVERQRVEQLRHLEGEGREEGESGVWHVTCPIEAGLPQCQLRIWAVTKRTRIRPRWHL